MMVVCGGITHGYHLIEPHHHSLDTSTFILCCNVPLAYSLNLLLAYGTFAGGPAVIRIGTDGDRLVTTRHKPILLTRPHRHKPQLSTAEKNERTDGRTKDPSPNLIDPALTRHCAAQHSTVQTRDVIYNCERGIYDTGKANVRVFVPRTFVGHLCWTSYAVRHDGEKRISNQHVSAFPSQAGLEGGSKEKNASRAASSLLAIAPTTRRNFKTTMPVGRRSLVPSIIT